MLKHLISDLYRLYSWQLPRILLIAYREHDSSLIKTAKWFMTSRTHQTKSRIIHPNDKPAEWLLIALMTGGIISGAWLLYWWAWHGTTGLWAFGLALLLGYPLITFVAFLFGFFLKRAAWYLLHPKKLGRAVVASILERQVVKLRRRHHFTVVAVAGSLGKTSTKLAIANLLGKNLRVLFQAGNYNDRITVPLVFFDQKEPALYSIFAWLKIFGENMAMISHSFPYDVVVVELGTDGPGQMKQFAYLKPDIGVLTSIAAEHLEYFGSMDAVAAEELTIFDYAKRMLVNGDDVPGKYMAGRIFEEYSLVTNVANNYYAKPSSKGLEGQELEVEFPSGKLAASIRYVGKQGAKYAVAAAAVADMLGMSHRDIADGLSRLEAFAGRMNILDALDGSLVIDDTYNASPEAVKAALDVLYERKASQRIAILGSMNELGDFSQEAHEDVGNYCDPKKLDLVVTIGDMAGKWLAAAAKEKGCAVHSFKSPYDAGKFVAKKMKHASVVLAEGSQNGVFAEEAVKQILAHKTDEKRLVRQTPFWLKVKAKQFGKQK